MGAFTGIAGIYSAVTCWAMRGGGGGGYERGICWAMRGGGGVNTKHVGD